MKTTLLRLAFLSMLLCFSGMIQAAVPVGNPLTCSLAVSDRDSFPVQSETKAAQSFQFSCSGTITSLKVSLTNPYATPTNVQYTLYKGGDVVAQLNTVPLPAQFDGVFNIPFTGVQVQANTTYRLFISASRVIWFHCSTPAAPKPAGNFLEFPDFGSTYSVYSLIFNATVGVKSPTLVTDSVMGGSGKQVAVPVRVKNFGANQTIQGNIDFGTDAVASLDSVVASSALTSDTHIAGTTSTFAGNIFTFSYDKDNGNMVLPDSTVLFTAYLRLKTLNSPSENACSMPTANGDYTPLEVGKITGNTSESTPMETAFGKVCVKLQTITIGTLGQACPKTPGYVVPFTSEGFDSSDVLYLYFNSTSSAPVDSATAADTQLTYTDSLPFSGSHTFYVTNADRSIQDDANFDVVNVFALANRYDQAVVMNDNGNYLVAGNDYNSCAPNGTKISVEGSGASFRYTYASANIPDSSGSTPSADGVIIPTQLTSDTISVSLHTTNSLGCVNPAPFSFTVHGDNEKPVFTLNHSTGSDIYVYYSNTPQLNIDVTSLFATYSDNCSDSADLVAKVYDSTNTEISQMNYFPGDYVLTFTVTDERNNTATAAYTLHVSKNPMFNIRQTGPIQGGGFGAMAIEYTAFAPGDANAYSFDSLDAYIDMPKLSDGVVISSSKPDAYDGTLQITTDSVGRLKVHLANVSGYVPNHPLFSVTVNQLIAPDTADVTDAYSVVRDIVISNDNESYPQTGDTVFNRINGLGVISGSFKPQGSDLDFDRPVDLYCDGCIRYGDVSDVAHLNQNGNGNTYSFRTSNTPVTFYITDLSNDDATTSTADAIIARQYVLKDYQFHTFQQIAGDVDNNIEINTLDVNQIRQNILQNRPKFVNGTGALSKYDFVTYIDNQGYGNVSGMVIGKTIKTFNYKVINLGEVSKYVMEPKIVAQDPIAFTLGSVAANNSAVVEVPVIAGTFDKVAGYQFTLSWNPTELEYTGYNPKIHTPSTGESLVNDGKLMISWLDAAAKNTSAKEGDVLFTVKFNVLGTIGSKSKIDFINQFTPVAAFDQDIAEKRIITTGGEVSVTTGINDLGNGYGIGNAMPNPFITGTTIAFTLPQSQDVTFTVYNALGQVASETIHYLSGVNSWTLPATDIMPAGVYTIVLKGEGLNQSVKVVKQ
ncbi:MAG: T9SS type A sorting domain-containing protein [Bacteroidota bacterium]